MEVEYFLKLSADKLLVFKWSQGQVYFLQNSYEICCVYVTLALHYLRFWFQTDLGPENSQLFKNTGGENFFLPWSRVGHDLRPIFMLWLVKIYAASWN